MVRNKLKLQPPHDEALMENEQMQHGATQSGNSLVSRQIHLSAAHHHPLHPANRQHRAIASCKSTPHEVMFSPGAGNNNGSNSSSSGVGIGISPMFGSLHSATKRSSVDYLLPAPPSHKSKTMPLFPLQPASAQQGQLNWSRRDSWVVRYDEICRSTIAANNSQRLNIRSQTIWCKFSYFIFPWLSHLEEPFSKHYFTALYNECNC